MGFGATRRCRMGGKAVDFIEASLGLHLGLQSLRPGITSSSGLSMKWGESGQTRVRTQLVGLTGGMSTEPGPGDDKAAADPDRWRDRATKARATAQLLHDRNIRSALLSIADGFERLGLRAHSVRRSEQPALMPQPQPAAAVRNGDVVPLEEKAPGENFAKTGREPPDTNLADTFRAMEALAPRPQAPMSANPDRIERVARALCQADGRDPDRSVETGQWQTVVSGGHQTRRPVTLRGWNVYEKDARQFLAALDAALDRS